MKTKRPNGPASCTLHDARVVSPAPAPRSRVLGLPWSLVSRRGRLGPSIVSHLGVATSTAVLLSLVHPVSAPNPAVPGGLVQEPLAPSEMSVDLRGGSLSPAGSPAVRSFAPEDHLGLVVRHNGRRSDQARLLVRAQPLSGSASTAHDGPEIFVGLDPQRVVWQGQALHYQGQLEEIMPLGKGLWRLTFMISDPRECEQRSLHVCARVDAWLYVQ
jgi:hypothetical protein